jgi:glycosyltransferase involved in cell wall biosynthesis
VAHFEPARLEIHLATLFEYPGRVDLYGELPANVTVHRTGLGRGGRARLKLHALARLLGVVGRVKPDVVVASMSSAHLACLVARIFRPFKLVLREHNAYEDKKPWHWLFDRIAAKVADAVIAVSSGVADYASAKAKVPRSRYEVIPNGVDLAAFAASAAEPRDSAARALGLDPAKRFVLHAARLKPQKNQRLLLDAYAALGRVLSDVELLIVGDGSERHDLESYAAERGQTGAHFFGFRKDVGRFFAVADAFCLTSDREGFPNSLVEALAAGVPVVTTDVPGVAEILAAGTGHARLAERHPQGVARELSVTLADGFSDRAAQRARCLAAASRFSVGATAERYAALFERLAGR